MDDFTPGDVVVIRDWDDMEQEFGLDGYGNVKCRCTFTTEMRRFCGQRVIIKSVNERGAVRFVDYPADVMGCYNYSTDMIRHEDESRYAIPEVPVSVFLSLIS